ncbi:hypothetical protein [Halosegnis longus]|uniref:hypothetical protein n=1 Tax=Halosegnis longus TaxID=2216012 RepID=UPI00129E82C6|nr:hypothetical protein [Halosegnis longus]
MSSSDFIVTIIVAICILGMLGTALGGFGVPKSESSYTGYVVDAEIDSGVITKTTQIHMKTHPQASNSETFCLTEGADSPMVDKIRDSVQNQIRIQVDYSRPFWVSPFECNSGLSTIDAVSLTN